MYMAMIMGWTIVTAFDEDMEKAKKNAIKEKKSLCRDDLERWTWDTVTDYYGTRVEELKSGAVITF